MSAVGENETAETESVGGETISVSWDADEPNTIAIVRAERPWKRERGEEKRRRGECGR